MKNMYACLKNSFALIVFSLILLTGIRCVARAETSETVTDAFNASGSEGKTYTTTKDSITIPIKADQPGYAKLYITINGISQSTGDDVAKITTAAMPYKDLSDAFVGMGYSTPGTKDDRAYVAFNESGIKACVVITKPKADLGNNATMTIVLEPRGFLPVTSEVHELGENEDLHVCLSPGDRYWPLSITGIKKIIVDPCYGVSFCDENKEEIKTYNDTLYLSPGKYYVKTSSASKYPTAYKIKYSSTSLSGKEWKNNTKRKKATSIKIGKKVSGVITSNDDSKRYFKIVLKKRTKITFTNCSNVSPEYSFTITDKKGKYLSVNKDICIFNTEVKKKGKVKIAFLNISNVKTIKKKQFYLNSGTYYLEISGSPGEYSFKVG